MATALLCGAMAVAELADPPRSIPGMDVPPTPFP
jgi:hypothetical protein